MSPRASANDPSIINTFKHSFLNHILVDTKEIEPRFSVKSEFQLIQEEAFAAPTKVAATRI
jgi:hypothetical protein